MSDANNEIVMGPKRVTRDGAPFLMAEIGVNHDGSVAIAEQLITAAARATADAVKFQLFRADLLLASQAGLVDYQKNAAADAEDLLEPLELSAERMAPLVKMAQDLGMAAIVTPFSVELVADCVAMGVDAIKLASPDLVNRPLLEKAMRTGLPLIVSTGAATLQEVERTVGWLREAKATDRTVILHCVSSYPTPAERATLAGIAALRERFTEMAVGYSDHTAETFTAAMAVGIGACLLEKHLTLSRSRKGPDHAASLEPDAFAEYAALARIGFTMRGPVGKKPQEAEMQVRAQTRQSVVSKKPLQTGTVLTREMLTVKRPGTGIAAAEFEKLLGKRLTRDVPGNSVLVEGDIAWE